ncbi:MAG: CocE/NonD family hydrolase [Caulobacterales bacterium]|nr:CocE/NonD family hydrolase [Caulobacterales bacterium]
MRIVKIVLAALVTVSAVTAEAQPARLNFLDTLIQEHTVATQPAELTTLARLQLAANRYREAETTFERLAARYQEHEPHRARAQTPWRIYARAMRYEQEGASKPHALARAFAELYGRLPDREAVDVLPLFNGNIARLRDAQTEAAEACANVAIDACPRAAQLIAARRALVVWDYLLPALQPLINADLDRRFIVERDLLIDTPDGAQISATLIRPRLAEGEHATSLLNFTIYARDDWAVSDAAKMAAYGYAGIVAFSRGKAASAGPITPYAHDGADAVAVINWLAAQSWSDGRVGMFSGSYNAAVAWSAAAHHPPALRAIATHASNAPGIDTPMRGGVFQNFMYPWPLYVSDGRGLDEFNYGDRDRWSALNRTWYVSGRSYREMERIDGHPNPIFQTWLDHPTYDGYWQSMIPHDADFASIEIPVLVQTGYYDGGVVGALHYLREHTRFRPNADHRLLIGPYHHTAMTTGVQASIAGHDIDEVARLDLQAIRLQWFDHVFRSTPLPELLRDRINFQVMGTNRWRHATSLEAMATQRLRLHLTNNRDGDNYALSRTAASGDGPELMVDFADRSDVDFEGSFDELDTRNALTFASAPFERRTEFVGTFAGSLNITINKRDVDLSVTLFEQREDGEYIHLASYLARASHMADRTQRRLLTPGRAHTLAFESDTLMGRRIERGSRIIALIGAPRSRDLQINYGTGRDVSDETVADAGEPLRLTFGSQSYLELGMRP